MNSEMRSVPVTLSSGRHAVVLLPYRSHASIHDLYPIAPQHRIAANKIQPFRLRLGSAGVWSKSSAISIWPLSRPGVRLARPSRWGSRSR